VDTLSTSTTNLANARADVVTGTNWNSSKNNWFVWITQGTSGNEGYLPSTPTVSHATKDKGDATVVLTGDLWGTSNTPDGVDILVGTASRGAGQGTIELWGNNDSKNTDFTNIDIYPKDASIPGNALGEVSGMALADFDGDGRRDLVVVAKTNGGYSGQLLFLRNQGRTSKPVFLYQSGYTLSSDLPTSVAVADVDGDGHPDVVIGTQNGAATGSIQYWRNTTPSIFDFKQTATVTAPGIVASVAAVDLGGGSRKDIAVGYRTSTSGYGGGLQVYYTDLGTLVGPGVDPSGGAVVNFVPAITTGNFNYGVDPSTPFPPYLDDIAIGVKSSDTAGAIVLLIR
jgi:hypothetical protein